MFHSLEISALCRCNYFRVVSSVFYFTFTVHCTKHYKPHVWNTCQLLKISHQDVHLSLLMDVPQVERGNTAIRCENHSSSISFNCVIISSLTVTISDSVFIGNYWPDVASANFFQFPSLCGHSFSREDMSTGRNKTE